MIFYPKSLLNGSPIVSPAKFQVYLEVITNIKYKAPLNWSAKVIASLGSQRLHEFRLLSLQTKFKKVLKEMRKRYISMKILLTTKCIIYRGIKTSINCDITLIILTISLRSWYSSNLSWGHFLNEFNISFLCEVISVDHYKFYIPLIRKKAWSSCVSLEHLLNCRGAQNLLDWKDPTNSQLYF